MKTQLVLAWLVGFGAVGMVGRAGVAEGPDRARVEAEAMGQAAEADRLFKDGDFAAALPLYEAERASRAALGDLRYEAYAARAIGCCQDRLGDLDAAIAAWEDARALDAQREDRGFEGYDWLLIGQAQLHLQRTEAAVESLTRALPLLNQAIDRDHEADARLLLAHALLAQGQPDRAAVHLDRARTLARALNDPKRQADVDAASGRVALERGAPGPAAEWFGTARKSYADQGRPADSAAMARLQGEALLALNRPDQAASCIEEAARAHEQLHDPAHLADDLQLLAALRAADGDLPAAQRLARRAVATCHEADDAPGEIAARVALAHIESQANDWTGAAATLAEALPLVRRDGTPAEQVRLLILAADVAHHAGNPTRSTTLLDEAERIARRADLGALIRLVADARQRIETAPDGDEQKH